MTLSWKIWKGNKLHYAPYSMPIDERPHFADENIRFYIEDLLRVKGSTLDPFSA